MNRADGYELRKEEERKTDSHKCACSTTLGLLGLEKIRRAVSIYI